MNRFVLSYIKLLGASYDSSLFEGGCTYTITLGGTSRRFTLYNGDSETPFNWSIAQWLHSQPWPSEDDPRIIDEGAAS